MGLAILAGWAAVLLATAWWWPEPYSGVWALVLEMAFTGRAVNIAHGYADGYSPWFLLMQCGLQDIWLILICYPLLLAGDEGLSRVPALGKIRSSMAAAAAAQQGRVERWGTPGLAFMVFIPFWSTGALVGLALGHAMALRPHRLLAIVIGSHMASVVTLLVLFDYVASWAEALNSSLLRFLPWAVLALLAVVHFGGKALSR
ncbi:MAG: small multi-drug export protein [Proteobacteria bacterium]|nr:small multi-drug export protein [Pseudomonadota bacterium]